MADFTKEVKLKVLIEAIKRTGKIKDVQRELNAVTSTAQKTGEKTAKAGAAGSKGMQQIGKSAEEAKKQLEAMSKAASTMVSVGLKLVGIGATLAGTAFFPIIAAARFEKTMSEVLAVTTNASANFKELNAVALEYGRTTKFTATQAAQGMAFLGRAGLTAAEVVSAIGPSLNLAAAGNIDLARSADIASNVLSAMALDVVELSHVTDILAHTASSSNTDINQLAEALKYAAPVAKAAGISLEETAAAMGVLGDAGIQACYDDQTEVLTENGWKLWASVIPTDQLATFNPDNQEMEWQTPRCLVRYDYKGKMYHVTNRGIDLCVTPNHRMWVRKRGERDFSVLTAEEISGKAVQYQTGGLKWKGGHPSHYKLPWFIQNRGVYQKVVPSVYIDATVWAAFLGWYLSEGSCDCINGTYRVRITQNPGPIRDRMRTVLSKLPWVVHEDENGFAILHEQLWREVEPFGKAPNKFVPSYAKNWSSTLLNLLLKAFQEGDGDDNSTIVTTAPQLRDDFMEIGLKCGYATRFCVKNNIGDTSQMKDGRIITARHTSWRVHFRSEQIFPWFAPYEYTGVHGERLDGSKFPAVEEWVEYDGEVFCAEVPNHFLLVRRNGKAIVSGNSMAGTSMRGMMIALSAPTKQAQDALDELGVTVARTADGSIDLITTFTNLSKAQMSLGQATAIFRRTSASAAITIASNVSKLKELTAENKIADGAALKLATTMQDNLGGAFTRLVSATSGLINAFGSPLLKPLAELIDLLAKVVSAVAGLATEFPLISGAITGVIAVLGLFITTLGAVLLTTGLLVKALVSLSKALKSQFLLDAIMALQKYSSAQALATVATGGFTKALRILGTVVKTHPLLFFTGLLLGAVVAYKAVSRGVEDRIEEIKKERRETDRLVSSFDDLTDALLKAEEGSDEQKTAALALRLELEKVVETNDKLAPAALKAAQSIDKQTGKINDQNEAIKTFNNLAFAEKIRATTEQMRLLGVAQKEALDPESIGLASAGWNQIRKWIGLSYSTTKKYNEEIAAGQARLEALASTTVAGLEELGRVDPAMSIEQFITLMDGMNLATDETRVHFIKAFTDIRKAHLAETDLQIDREKQTTQEIIAEVQVRVDKQIKTLSQLSRAYDTASKTARLTPKDLGAQNAMIEAGRERTRVVEKMDESLRLLAQEEVAEAKIAKETALAAMGIEKARGEIDQKEAKERKLKIEADYQAAVLRIRQGTLAAFKQAGAAETEEAKAHNQNLINITARAAKTQADLENHRAKMAVAARKEQLKQEQALMEARVDLSAQKIDNELEALQHGYDNGLIDLDTYLEKRQQLTTKKLDEEVALLRKKLEQATKKERPILEIELRVKEAERAGALAGLYAEDDEERKAHAEKVAQNEIVLLGLKKDALGEGLVALKEQHALELEEFNLQTERIVASLVGRGATEDQILEAKKSREVARMKTVEAQEQASLTARLSLIQTFAGGAKQLFSDLYDLTGKKSKEMFYIAKAAAVAESIMNTAKAVTAALPNMAMAAIVGAMGAVQVAKIMAQRMAQGGPVVGGSGMKDDVPILGMGGEYMQPKPSVQYYGADVMEGLRQRLIPKEIFSGLRVPQTVYAPTSGHFQEGGQVKSGGQGRAAPAMGAGEGGGGEITIINVTDSRELDTYLSTPRGQDAILNVLSSRQTAVRRIVR